MFICPICGSNSYSKVLAEIFRCDNCSVLFDDAIKFSGAKGNEENKNTKRTTGKAHIYHEVVGGVVSTPIKLNRR